jgi:hypothetical protein
MYSTSLATTVSPTTFTDPAPKSITIAFWMATENNVSQKDSILTIGQRMNGTITNFPEVVGNKCNVATLGGMHCDSRF